MDPLFLAVLKKEIVDVLRGDTAVLRQDIDVLHQDIQAVRQDIATVDSKLENHIIATNARFDTVDQRFTIIDQRFDTVDQRFTAIDQRFDTVDEQFSETREMIQNLASHTDAQFKDIRGDMATKGDLQRFITKDYLDDKLADLRSDLVIMARKGNKKLEAFVEELVSEKRLPRAAARRILMLEPFPLA